jgi:hypothetical protein
VNAVTAKALTLALLLAPAGVAAQGAPNMPSPRPGGAGPALPPHVQAQLWPERELSPVEQELKQHVTTLGDSLVRIDATGAMIERQSRAGASAAIVRSSARNLAADCSRAGRAAVPATSFAATLSTNDAKWGEPAVRGWRSGLATLGRDLSACERAANAFVETGTAADADALRDVSHRVGQGLVTYRRSEQALLRTLKLSIEPVKKGR